VSALDVCDARTMGADAVLLIVAALDDVELTSLLSLARTLRLAPLVEVHDEAERDRARQKAGFLHAPETKGVSQGFALRAPIAGEVIESNAALKDDPSLVNQDPFGKGWLIKVKATAGMDKLMTAAEYDAKHS